MKSTHVVIVGVVNVLLRRFCAVLVSTISPIVLLREKPLRKSTFILDVHLGRLSKSLRMLGFDSLYRNDYEDSEIISISVKEKRIIHVS